MAKYFPENVRERKEVEFLTLVQGNMSVGEYAARFEELSRFHPHYHNAQDERSKCVKFVSGLRSEVKKAIRMQEIREFSMLVNRCKIFEEDCQEEMARAKTESDRKSVV